MKAAWVVKFQSVVQCNSSLAGVTAVLEPLFNIMATSLETTLKQLTHFKTTFPKIYPQRIVKAGKTPFACPVCQVLQQNWSGMDSHICERHTLMKCHPNQSCSTFASFNKCWFHYHTQKECFKASNDFIKKRNRLNSMPQIWSNIMITPCHETIFSYPGI